MENIHFCSQSTNRSLFTQSYLHKFHLADSSEYLLWWDAEVDLQHVLLGCQAPVLHRDSLRREVREVEKTLKDKKHWALILLIDDEMRWTSVHRLYVELEIQRKK